MSDVLYVDLTVEIAPGDDYTVANASKTWTEISSDVRLGDGVKITGGRDTEFGFVNPSTATLWLNNQSRDYEPGYSSGTHYPYFRPGLPIRISADKTTPSISGVLFTGYVLEIVAHQETPLHNRVELRCGDALALFARLEIGPTYRELVRKDGAIAHWPLYETQGSTFFDAVGSHHGYLTGSPVLGLVDSDSGTEIVGPGKFLASEPFAMKFDGADVTAKVRLNPSLWLSGPLSIELWISGVSLNSGNEAVLAGLIYNDGGADWSPWQIIIGDATSNFTFRWTNNDEVGEMLFTGSTPYSGYVVVTRDENGHLEGYNGGTVGPTTSALNNGGLTVPTWDDLSPEPTGSSVLVGTDDANADTVRINNIAIYDKVLTQEQMDSHYLAYYDRWPEELTSARITRILDAISWPSGDRDIDTGVTTLPASQVVTGQSALSALRGVESAEGGFLYQKPDGDIAFDNSSARATLIAAGAVADFGGSDEALQPITPTNSYAFIFNVVSVDYNEAEASARITVEDSTSKDTYGPSTKRLLETQPTRDDAYHLASWIVAKYKDDHTRIPDLTIYPQKDPSTLFPLVVEDIGFGSVIGIEHQPVGGGSANTYLQMVERITHDISDGFWTTTYELSPAELYEALILNDSEYGKLNNYPLGV